MTPTKFLLLMALLGVFLVTTAQHYIVSTPDAEFNCSMISTATTLTELTDCAVLTTGKKRYITSMQWSSSIISTTTNFFSLVVGQGAACATSARTVHAGFAQVAFSGREAVFATPIASDANDAICFSHPGAGTRNVTVQGFIK